MKKLLLSTAILFSLLSYGQHLKKDGTPDMRYKENKENYNYSTPAYEAPKEREYNNGGQLYYQSGYIKSNGTYVEPHLKTKPDNTELNNWNEINKEEKKDEE